jgi:hypothetical protein
MLSTPSLPHQNTVTETKKKTRRLLLIKHQINYTIQKTPNLSLKQINIIKKIQTQTKQNLSIIIGTVQPT